MLRKGIHWWTQLLFQRLEDALTKGLNSKFFTEANIDLGPLPGSTIKEPTKSSDRSHSVLSSSNPLLVGDRNVTRGLCGILQ